MPVLITGVAFLASVKAAKAHRAELALIDDAGAPHTQRRAATNRLALAVAATMAVAMLRTVPRRCRGGGTQYSNLNRGSKIPYKLSGDKALD